jgi:hypothetical protein
LAQQLGTDVARFAGALNNVGPQLAIAVYLAGTTLKQDAINLQQAGYQGRQALSPADRVGVDAMEFGTVLPALTATPGTTATALKVAQPVFSTGDTNAATLIAAGYAAYEAGLSIAAADAFSHIHADGAAAGFTPLQVDQFSAASYAQIAPVMGQIQQAVALDQRLAGQAAQIAAPAPVVQTPTPTAAANPIGLGAQSDNAPLDNGNRGIVVMGGNSTLGTVVVSNSGSTVANKGGSNVTGSSSITTAHQSAKTIRGPVITTRGANNPGTGSTIPSQGSKNGSSGSVTVGAGTIIGGGTLAYTGGTSSSAGGSITIMSGARTFVSASSQNVGSATIIDSGSLVKGAGYFHNSL